MSQILEKEIHALRQRNGSAIEKLVADHSAPLLNAALGLGFSGPDAEELVQDVFVAFLSAVERFEMRSQLKTYLFGILYNKAKETWRRAQRETATENIEQVFEKRFDARGMWVVPPRRPDEDADIQEIAAWIETCAEQIPPQQKTAFFLKEVEGQTTESICKMLEISRTHLGVLLFRARTKLRECLEKNWRKR